MSKAAPPAVAKVTVWPEETEPPISMVALLEMLSDPVPLTLPLISMIEILLPLNGPAVTVPLLTRFPSTVKTAPGAANNVTPEFTNRLPISTFVVLETVYGVPVALIATFSFWMGTPLLQSEEVIQSPLPEWVESSPTVSVLVTGVLEPLIALPSVTTQVMVRALSVPALVGSPLVGLKL